MWKRYIQDKSDKSHQEYKSTKKNSKGKGNGSKTENMAGCWQ